MSALSISAVSLVSSIEVALQAPTGASTSNFLALLNLSTSRTQADGTLTPENNDNSNTQNASENESSVESDFFSSNQDYTSPPVVQQSAPQDAPVSNAVQDTTTARNNSQDNTSDIQKQSDASNPAQQNMSQSVSSSDVQSGTTQSAAASSNSGTAGNTGSTNGNTSTSKQLRSGLQDQLASIDQLLASMIQALSSAIPTATTPVVSTTVTGAAATEAVAGQSAGDPTATELSLLKDMQSLLQQMQQALQTPGALPATGASSSAGQGTPLEQLQAILQGGTEDPMQTLTDSLQKDVSQLSQLLTQQGSAASTAQNALQTALQQSAQTAVSDTSSANTQQPLDLATMIKSGIAQVRGQLQKLNADNETVFAQAKTLFQSQLAGSQQTNEAMAAKAAGSQSSALPVGTANPTDPVATPVQTASNTQLMDPSQVSTAQAAAFIQSGSGNMADSNSGNGNQGQNNAQPVVALGAGQTQAGNGVSGSSFARTLSQASAGQLSPSPVLEQVAFQVKTAVSDGSSKIHIQLDPAELGKVDIKLNVGADGKTGVVITVDNHTTLDLLQRDTQGLTRALTDAGLSMDSGSMSFNLSSGQQGQGNGNNAQAASTYQKTQPDEEDDMPVGSITRSYSVTLSDGLDISI